MGAWLGVRGLGLGSGSAFWAWGFSRAWVGSGLEAWGWGLGLGLFWGGVWGLGVWGLRVFRGLGLKVQTISIIGKPVGVLDSVRLHVVIMESKPQYVSYF